VVGNIPAASLAEVTEPSAILVVFIELLAIVGLG
jgi:hypothetical protein